MKLNKKQKVVLIVVIILFSINLYANGYLRVKIRIIEAMRLCYEKLAVAYNIGGKEGLKKEYAIIYENNKGHAEAQKFLEKVGVKVNRAENPSEYLQTIIDNEKKEIWHLRLTVILLSLLIVTILSVRVIRDFFSKPGMP